MSVLPVTRRAFLGHGLAVAGALVLGVRLRAAAAEDMDAVADVDAFVRIGKDNKVTVIVKHIEFGQGTFTGLTTLVAEELDAAWSQMHAEGAPADPARYANLNWGGSQGTGGSSSINNAYTQMRRAGATARAMLVAAAARRWSVRAGEISVSAGVVEHGASKRRASFGELAEAAASESVPKNVVLKQPAQFVFIGHDVPRLDSAEKSRGAAVYTQDFRLPGMLTAVVAHPPRFEGRVASVDTRAALELAGVHAVIELPTGVAVVADNFWLAHKAREQLEITWDDSHAADVDSAALLAHYRELAARPGLLATDRGDVDRALADAATRLSAEYSFPYLAHACMEPMNCVARVTDDKAEFWYGVQGQSLDLGNLSRALDMPRDRIELNMLYAGGSFGRRSHNRSDYAVEAARIAQRMPGTPIKLVWTREDDMRAGAYRPMYLHQAEAALDSEGQLQGWRHRIVGQSLRAGLPSPPPVDQVDRTVVEGISNLPYDVPNLHVDVHQPAVPVPVLWWRSVGHTHTAFAAESFLDEIAHAAGRDPLALRLQLLPDDARRRAVLETAAAAAGWADPLPAGRGRGIAVHRSFKTWVAEVAEVTMGEDGDFSVDRIVLAVDCGVAVNPSIVRAQMEGGIGYALSALRGEAIELVDGVVQADNFDTYPILRYSQMPEIEVHIVPSSADPTGVGEPAVPPLAPAVANAIFAASGKRHRVLPFSTTETG